SGVLGDLGLLRGDDVHDDAALEHLGHASLDAGGAHLADARRAGRGSGGLGQRNLTVFLRARPWRGAGHADVVHAVPPILRACQERSIPSGIWSSSSTVCGNGARPASRSHRTRRGLRARCAWATASLWKRRASWARYHAAPRSPTSSAPGSESRRPATVSESSSTERSV